MNRVTLAVLVLAVMVCFFARDDSTLEYFHITEANMTKDTKSLDIDDNLRIPSFFIGRPHFVHNEKQKIIVFRDDDIGPDWSVNSAIYITDLFRRMNVSHVLGIVPANIDGRKLDDDTVLYNYLKSIKDDESIEFALHGYDHSLNEFESIELNGSPDSAMSKIYSGIRIIEDVVGITPVTFVPPYGVYNENTRIALKSTDSLHIMSTCQTGIKGNRAFKEVDGLLYLPSTTYFYNWDEKRYNTHKEIISSCNHAFDKYGVCVIVFHHHMLKDDSANMDPTKVQELINVIEWARSKEHDGSAKIMLLKDISKDDLQ
ncbi:MAG: hypothetical protein DRN71_01470 [Candidatus Nanohalarchaeota archaeon]|nr:MAG: hypothetical protein DRN71_01470 [Candidatus Nanohaloarchaeota archaeon]